MALLIGRALVPMESVLPKARNFPDGFFSASQRPWEGDTMSSHPRMQRLGEELACSRRRSDRGQGWKRGGPPVLAGRLIFLTMATLES